MQRLSVGPLGPFLKEDLNLTSAQVGLFMSAAAFGYMLALIPAGWLVDRIGVRWLFLIGEVIGGIFIASMFTVTTFTGGLIFMALAGLGLGCIMPSTTKAVLVWFPIKERATAMGVKQTAINVGGIITATTLPTIALALSWHYGFLSIGFIAVVIGIVSFILYKEPPQSGSLNTSEPAIPSGPRPSVREVFRSRDIWLLIGAGMCMMALEFSAIAYFVLYLKEALFFTVVTAGFFLAILEAGGVFGKPITGLMSDRLFHGGRKKVYILMCCITFAICMIFAFLGQGSPSWMIIPLCLILGFVGIGWGGLHLTLVGEFAGKELAGIVTGMCTVFLMIANMAGPPAFGHIVDTTGSYRIAWQFLAILGLLAAILLLFVREEKRRI
ncbi:putative glucarate transporter [subsurface metagenome]